MPGSEGASRQVWSWGEEAVGKQEAVGKPEVAWPWLRGRGNRAKAFGYSQQESDAIWWAANPFRSGEP